MERLAALQWLAVAAVIAGLAYLLGPILSPFAAAAILAYICNPLVGRLCAWKLRRTPASLLVMAALFGLLLLMLLVMLPLLEKETRLFVTRLPELLEAARARLLPYLEQNFGVGLQWDAQAVRGMLAENWQGAGGAAAKALPWLGGGGAALLGILMNLALIPVVFFYLLRDWPLLLTRIEQLIPRNSHAKALQISAEIDGVLAEFLRGQLMTMLLMSAFYVLALWFVGLEFALPIGLMAGMLVFVPYLGTITGLALATLAAATQFGSFSGVLLVWAIFGAGQVLEGFVVTPRLVGERIGLHPLAVIFSLLAFGQLFGFFGVLLALPVSAALLVGLRHAREGYLASSFYRDGS